MMHNSRSYLVLASDGQSIEILSKLYALMDYLPLQPATTNFLWRPDKSEYFVPGF